MSKFRKGAVIAATAVVTLALAACSDSSSPDASGDGNGSDTPMGNTLTVWAWDPAFNIAALNAAADIYKKDHPDFTIDIVETPWDDLQTKLTTIAQSQAYDELPDIFLMQNNAFQKNVINYPDLFSDFSGSDVDYSEFPEGVTGYSTVDGANFGVPFDNGTAIDALRTDVLTEAGLTVDDFTDITWSDYMTKAKDVLAKTGQPMLSGQAGSSDMVMMMLQSAGASLFDADGNPTIANNEALTKAAGVYTQMVKDGTFLEVNSWDEYIGTLVNSNVAGTINGVWIVGSIQSAADQSGKWGMTNLPSLDGVSGATNYSANGGSSWAVSSTADVALAQDFLNSTFAGSTEFYDTILPSTGALANWLPAGESAVYAEPQEFWGGDAIFQKVVGYAGKVPANNTGVYYYEARDAVSAALTEIVNGADPATAFQKAQETVEFAMQ